MMYAPDPRYTTRRSYDPKGQRPKISVSFDALIKGWNDCCIPRKADGTQAIDPESKLGKMIFPENDDKVIEAAIKEAKQLRADSYTLRKGSVLSLSDVNPYLSGYLKSLDQQIENRDKLIAEQKQQISDLNDALTNLFNALPPTVKSALQALAEKQHQFSETITFRPIWRA